MDIEISEADFLKYTSANDASLGTMIALLNAKVIDSLYPDRDKKIMGSYIINARPMLDELKRNGISYKVHKHIPADNAHFPLP